MKIEGVSKLMQQLGDRAKKSLREDNVSVVVGYTAAYALYVHECIEMKLQGQPRVGPAQDQEHWYYDKNGKIKTRKTRAKISAHRGFFWDPQGRAQAKFLETPARLYVDRIRQIVVNTYKMEGNLEKALLMGGLYLQRESMQLVPVDTGNLKNSAFTRVEEEGEA